MSAHLDARLLYAIYCSSFVGITTGAVCVYPNRVADCVKYLKAAGASHIPIASGLSQLGVSHEGVL